MVQWKRIGVGTMRLQVRSLASLSGLRIWHCRELWCRSQTWLISAVEAQPPTLLTLCLQVKKQRRGVPVMAQWLTNPTGNHEVEVRSLPLLSGLMIRRCRELWCRLQTQLGSRVAVAVA